MSEQQPENFETLQVHSGYTPDPLTRSNSVPIYSTACFRLDSTARATKLFALQEDGNIYSRISNPTLDAFEKRMAALEGGIAAVSAASGQSAIFMTLMTLVHAGENVVVSSSLYGGVYNMFKVRFPTFGVTTKFVDGGRPEDIAAAIDDKTRAVYVESISNPSFDIPDIEAIAQVAHDKGLPLVVDNTFGVGGRFVRPIDHGADIVVHSATKFLGGHGTTIGGILIDAGTFDWGKAAARFPDMAGPSKSYHGLNFWEIFGHNAFNARLRAEMMRDIGACLSPFAAQQILIGIETLSLRADRFGSNAMALARWLKGNEHVSWVLYPGLEDHPSHALAKKYCHNGFGGLLSFGIKGGAEEGSKVVDSLKLVVNAANIGECQTMAIHCWETTHGQLKDEEKRSAGVTPDMIRIAVGIEHIDDLIADFEQSFRVVFPHYNTTKLNTAGLVPNKSWVFKKTPTGFCQPGVHTVIEDQPLKLVPESGGVAIKMLAFGVDPHLRDRMRGLGPDNYTPCYEPNEVISNFSIARVIASNSERFNAGDLIQGILPISEYALIPKSTIDAYYMASPAVWKPENTYNLDYKHFIGPLGLAGMTAWTSFYGLVKPTKGETIWVNAASSAVGEVVVQLAKMEGMRVIASVSSDEKLKYVLNELGADAAFNYKEEKTSDALKRLAPDGIDVVYDNVGGNHFQAAVENMKLFGRIVCCGWVSQYNTPVDKSYGVTNLGEIFRRRLVIQGFIYWDENIYPQHIDKFWEVMPKLVAEGKMRSRYTHYHGIEQVDKAFRDLFTGGLFGKGVITMV